MSNNAPSSAAVTPHRHRNTASSLALLVWRATLVTARDTGQLVMFIVQPILFFAMFWLILGGSFELAFGGSYRDFIAPGIAAAAVVFGAQGGVGAGIAVDRFDGFLGRLKPLGIPLFNAVLARVAVDAGRNVLGCTIIFIFSVAVGLRPQSWGGMLVALVPLVGLGIAIAFPVAWLSLISSSQAAAMSTQLVFLMPIGFISSAYIPVKALPTAFQGIASWNPVTTTADMVRRLLDDQPAELGPWLVSCGLTAAVGIVGIAIQLRRASF